MNILIPILLFASVCCVFAGDLPPGFVIPDSLKAEGEALKVKVDALKLPMTPDGKHPDICQIKDAALKAEVFGFITKVNAAGGTMPIPPCSA